MRRNMRSYTLTMSHNVQRAILEVEPVLELGNKYAEGPILCQQAWATSTSWAVFSHVELFAGSQALTPHERTHAV